MIPTSEADPTPFSLDELLGFERAMRNSERGQAARNAVIALVFTHCPIDLAEIAGLKRASVDLDARLLRGACKHGGAHEDVPFNDVVAEALEAYIAERDLLPADSDSLLLSGELVPLSVQDAQGVVSAARTGGILSVSTRPDRTMNSSVEV